ncbi:MAG: Scr1 family TA system antitoxin-like transcriptional regulator [Labedaea sp.]
MDRSGSGGHVILAVRSDPCAIAPPFPFPPGGVDAPLMLEPGRHDDTRLSIAEALRGLRRTVGITSEGLADRTGISQSKISKIETGKFVPSIADIQRIIRALDVDRDYAAELLERAQVGTIEYEPYRVARRRGISTVQRELAAIERSSSYVRHLLPTMVTTLLQTRAYARQWSISSVDSGLTADTCAQVVADKIARQQVLSDTNKRFSFVFAEPALRWRIVGAADMVDQLDQIVSISELPTVSVAVVPAAAQVSGSPICTSLIYDEQLVQLVTASGLVALRSPHDVAYYLDQFEYYHSNALTGDEARDFIRGIAGEFRAEVGDAGHIRQGE